MRNVIERAVLFCRGNQITAEELPAALRGDDSGGGQDKPSRVRPLNQAVEEAETAAIRAALSATNGRRADAAELLGISRKTLWEKIKSHDITVD